MVEVRFLHSAVAGSISSGALLMRPNKVETAVQCSVGRMWVFAGFSGYGNLIKYYIYVYMEINLIVCRHKEYEKIKYVEDGIIYNQILCNCSKFWILKVVMWYLLNHFQI